MYSENVPTWESFSVYINNKKRKRGITMTKEEFEAKKAKVAGYRPIDDVFFEALAER